MWSDIWGTHNFIVCLVLLAFFGWYIGTTYRYVHGIAAAYFLTSALGIFMNPDMPYVKVDYRIMWSTAAAFSIGILCLTFSVLATRKVVDRVLELIEYIIVLDSFVVLFYGFGIFNASTFDASIIAIVYPSLFLRNGFKFADNKWSKIWFAICVFVPLVAMIRVTSSTVFYILIAQAGVVLIMQKRFGTALFISAVIFCAGVLRNGELFFSSSLRVPVWELMMNIWWNKLNIWTGTATGTYHYLGPIYQPNDQDQFLFLHNEYLQVLFEQGICGFVLLLGVLFSCLKRAWGNMYLMTTWAGILVCCLAQFPFRFALSLLFILLIVRISSERYA